MAELLHEPIREGGAEGGVTNMHRDDVAGGVLHAHLTPHTQNTVGHLTMVVVWYQWVLLSKCEETNKKYSYLGRILNE